MISTDPASSLADAFQLPPVRRGAARDRPRRVRTVHGALHVVEIDAPRALERWLGERRDVLERIALRGTWLDEDDVARLLRLSLPGIDEIAALIEIARYGRSAAFDLVVVDTAPTGHTLRMLVMPDTLIAIARVFDHMQEKHRVMVDALTGSWTPDAADTLIAELHRDGSELWALLRDRTNVRTSWVTLPEPMAIEETADAASQLRGQGLAIDRIIVNRLTPGPPEPCAWCDSRRGFERRALASAERIAAPGTVAAVTAQDREPRDVRAFATIGVELGRPPVPAPKSPRTGRWRGTVTATPDAIRAVIDPRTRLLIMGGKGGTGKTTCAAAAALRAAAAEPNHRVLLLSTDPAHSLGDVLGCPLTDALQRVEGASANLEVRELDASRGFTALRERYGDAIDALFERGWRGDGIVDARSDRLIMHGLIDLAPPGVDELAAVIDVTDALDDSAAGRFDLIVMDTAPSGHALRLLEMPSLVQDWVRTLMSILLKYRSVTGLGELGAMLLKLSQGLGRLRELLTDATRARFVVVSRAAALPRAETGRLLARLRAMHISVPVVVINAVGRGTCRRCRTAVASERREIAALRRLAAGSRRDTVVVLAPAEVPPPHGSGDLRRWSAAWGLAQPTGRR